MAHVFDQNRTRAELVDRVEDMAQLAGARRATLVEGAEQGTEVVEMWNSSGLNLSILPSRCLDIAHASYKGVPLCFRGGCGDVSPTHFESQGVEWLRGFFGGLVTTCGLTFVGHVETDPDEENSPLGLHGRASFLPARRVSVDEQWEGDDYVIRLSGSMLEWSTLGTKLEMRREITLRLGERKFIFRDVVINRSLHKRAPLMVVYHCNLGFPLLDAGSRWLCRSRRTTEAGSGKEVGPAVFGTIASPSLPPRDPVFVHDLATDAHGRCQIALVNDQLSGGLGLYWRYRKSDLPILNQWHHFAAGEYVMGVEPGNCSVLGRKTNRTAGTLQHIGPGEQREFVMEIGILEGGGEIQAFERELAACPSK